MFVDVFHRHGWSFFPSVRLKAGVWQGVVGVRTSAEARIEYLCQMKRETKSEAIEDAIAAAMKLTEMV